MMMSEYLSQEEFNELLKKNPMYGKLLRFIADNMNCYENDSQEWQYWNEIKKLVKFEGMKRK